MVYAETEIIVKIKNEYLIYFTINLTPVKIKNYNHRTTLFIEIRFQLFHDI